MRHMKQQQKKSVLGQAKQKHPSPGGRDASRLFDWWKSIAPRTRLAGTVVVLLVVAIVFLAWPSKEVPHHITEDAMPGRDVVMAGSDSGPPPERTPADDPARDDRMMIRSVVLSPSTPTRLDELVADVVPLDPARTDVQYRYRWQVNQQTVQEGTSNRLDLESFQVRDAVSVVVTPHDGDQSGFAVESLVIAIHGAIPTLTLEPIRQPVHPGDPVRLQLAGSHPDGDPLIFRLEEPRVSGMTINESSGEILFMPAPDLTGKIFFGVSVEDSHGTRVSKVFELDLHLE